MGQRLRVSDNQAKLLTSLTNDETAKLLAAITDFRYQGAVPSPDEPLPVIAPRVTYPAPLTGGDPDRVLVIGDLHAPFIKENYLEWCLEQQKRWNCKQVVCIGDVADFHAISYHESDPDGMSAGHEYKAAKEQLAKLFHLFPGTPENPVYSCLGNHDLLIARKAKTAGLSTHFVRSLGEVYGAPATWKFVDEVEINDVVYRHGGVGGDALRMATHSRRSTVQGHLHTKFYTQYLVSERDAIFATQVGAGCDDKAYAFAYGRPFPQKSAIGCAIILDKGKTAVNLLMPL